MNGTRRIRASHEKTVRLLRINLINQCRQLYKKTSYSEQIYGFWLQIEQFLNLSFHVTSLAIKITTPESLSPHRWDSWSKNLLLVTDICQILKLFPVQRILHIRREHFFKRLGRNLRLKMFLFKLVSSYSLLFMRTYLLKVFWHSTKSTWS